MTEHSLAVAALIVAAGGLFIDVVALYFLVGIWRDDRAMRSAAEKSLQAQLEYLGLRRKWYESRTKKKENEKADLRPVDGSSSNGM